MHFIIFLVTIVQLYLCGLPVKKLEKLRRLVSAAGGLRFNLLSEELTHVILGEPDQDLKTFLSKTTHRLAPWSIMEKTLTLIPLFFKKISPDLTW